MGNAIIETNVAITASKKHEAASPQCVENCIHKILEIKNDINNKLILDLNDEVFTEYHDNGYLSMSGQPGVGDIFLKWVHTNKENPEQCIKLTLEKDGDNYLDFPGVPELEDFDLNDRKFAVLSIMSGVPVSNATDSDWKHYEEELGENGIQVEFLCPDYEFKEKKRG